MTTLAQWALETKRERSSITGIPVPTAFLPFPKSFDLRCRHELFDLPSTLFRSAIFRQKSFDPPSFIEHVLISVSASKSNAIQTSLSAHLTNVRRSLFLTNRPCDPVHFAQPQDRSKLLNNDLIA
jgi:hypothetical protein